MERELKRLQPETPTRPWFQLVLRPEVAAKMSVKERLQTQRLIRLTQARLEEKLGICRPPRRLP